MKINFFFKFINLACFLNFTQYFDPGRPWSEKFRRGPRASSENCGPPGSTMPSLPQQEKFQGAALRSSCYPCHLKEDPHCHVKMVLLWPVSEKIGVYRPFLPVSKGAMSNLENFINIKNPPSSFPSLELYALSTINKAVLRFRTKFIQSIRRQLLII